MKTKLFGTVCVLSALAVVACGDDESGEGGSGGSTTTATNTTGTGTTKTGTGTGSTNSASTGGGDECPLPDTTAPGTCDEACSDLYDCGALTCNGTDLCAFTGDAAEKTAFVEGCLKSCASLMALIALVDPSDCAETITVLKGANAQFNTTCTEGIPMGTGGGGGGN